MCDPITNSFFGTQPRITQVPPIRYSSATTTRAPYPAAMRAARTPPEPPPITNRSTSNSAMVSPDRVWSHRSDLLAALAHLGAEIGIDLFGKPLRPLGHVSHALLNRLRLGRQQFLPQRRFVEGHQILQFLLGELARVDLCHPLADFLLATGQLLGHDHRNLVQILLIVEIGLQQLVL